MDIDTSNLTLKVTDHALRTILNKSIDPFAVRNVFCNPTKVTEVTAHAGQVRLIGHGIALVGRVEGGFFTLITVYEDQKLTPPRADQLNTPEGRRYAERYARGLGRG